MGCHFLLQCMKVKSECEVAQLCPTLSNPMDCSLPGSSIHGIFQARVLEWGAIAFSNIYTYIYIHTQLNHCCSAEINNLINQPYFNKIKFFKSTAQMNLLVCQAVDTQHSPSAQSQCYESSYGGNSFWGASVSRHIVQLLLGDEKCLPDKPE